MWGWNYLFLNVINGTEIITQLHDLLYSHEFSSFDLGIPYIPHMTVGKLKTVDELNGAYDSVKENKTSFKSNITKISVEMIGENEESIIVIAKKVVEVKWKSKFSLDSFWSRIFDIKQLFHSYPIQKYPEKCYNPY